MTDESKAKLEELYENVEKLPDNGKEILLAYGEGLVAGATLRPKLDDNEQSE